MAPLNLANLSTTARVGILLNKKYFKQEALPDNSPLLTPIIDYTRLDLALAITRRAFTTLPQVSLQRSDIANGLSTLKSIAENPNAKGANTLAQTNYNVFIQTYAEPHKALTELLAKVDNFRNDCNEISKIEKETLVALLDKIIKSPSPETASASPEARNTFESLNAQLKKVDTGLAALNVSLTNSSQKLEGIFKQINSAIGNIASQYPNMGVKTITATSVNPDTPHLGNT
jgi:hypothetical protein